MASTTTKPSMIFPRNRKLGNFSDISRGMRFNNLASRLVIPEGPALGRGMPAARLYAET
jgi:hypothetical protein